MDYNGEQNADDTDVAQEENDADDNEVQTDDVNNEDDAYNENADENDENNDNYERMYNDDIIDTNDENGIDNETLAEFVVMFNEYIVEPEEIDYDSDSITETLGEILVKCVNLTDTFENMRKKMAYFSGFLEALNLFLPMYSSSNVNKKEGESDDMESMVLCVLNIVFNISTKSNLKHNTRLRAHGFKETLQPYLVSTKETITLLALGSLACIVNEAECDIINTASESVDFLFEVFGNGLRHEERIDNGWSTLECGNIIKHLDRNDNNKKMLVEKGAFKLLVKMGKTGSKDEQKGGDANRHIMISYTWADQMIMNKICKQLEEAKFKMDIENMSGSTIQAMAEAIENANIVIMSMSQKYKDSKPCRMEAEYANQIEKTIIPLKLQNNYKPDGWLGLICGSKLFFDFSGKYKFDDKMKELLKEIENQWKIQPKSTKAIQAIKTKSTSCQIL